MISEKTTFVLGAGASYDFGFPTGESLINLITNLLTFGRLPDNRPTGDDFLINYFTKYRSNGINYYRHCRAIKEALPHNLSIDNFLKDRNDPIISEISKLAITKIIFDAELNLFAKNYENYSWISVFLTLIKDGYSRDQVNNVFEKISVINFNYDRSFEVMLTFALANAYDIEIREALSIVKKLNVVHPYGSLGQISESIEFSKSEDILTHHYFYPRLVEISKEIRTFSEAQQLGILQECQNIINLSNRVVFLGFGFHKVNLELLKPNPETQGGRYSIYATVLNETSTSIKIIESRIREKFKTKNIQLLNCDSIALLRENKRSFLDY